MQELVRTLGRCWHAWLQRLFWMLYNSTVAACSIRQKAVDEECAPGSQLMAAGAQALAQVLYRPNQTRLSSCPHAHTHARTHTHTHTHTQSPEAAVEALACVYTYGQSHRI